MKKLKSSEILNKDLQNAFNEFYHRFLSDRMKRSWAIRKKKMLATGIVKNCKV